MHEADDIPRCASPAYSLQHLTLADAFDSSQDQDTASVVDTSPALALSRADSAESLMSFDEHMDMLLNSPRSIETARQDDDDSSSRHLSSAADGTPPLSEKSLRGGGAVISPDAMSTGSSASQSDTQDTESMEGSFTQEASSPEPSQAGNATAEECWQAHMAEMDGLFSPSADIDMLCMSTRERVCAAAGDLAQQDAASTAALEPSFAMVPALDTCAQVHACQQSATTQSAESHSFNVVNSRDQAFTGQNLGGSDLSL